MCPVGRDKVKKLIKNKEGFGLVHAMVIVAVVGGISYFIMDALNLNNRILQNVSSAKIIDDVVDDIYNRLKDPEMCAVDYYVSKEFDDYTEYAKFFNRRLYQNDLALYPRATTPSPGVTQVRGTFHAFGNFFWKNSATASQRINFILNKRGVETYKMTDEVRYRQWLDGDGKDVFDYSTMRLDYNTVVTPPTNPADNLVAYWALPAGTNIDTIYQGASLDEKYIIGDRVAIKDMYLQNYVYDATLQMGTMDLVIIFIKNVKQTLFEGGPQSNLGSRLTRRVIKLNVSLFRTPSTTANTLNNYTPTYVSNTRIRKCYADKENYITKLTKYYCEQNEGSFRNGECLGFDAAVLRTVRQQICTDMYGAAQWNAATQKCELPTCKYGITGFTAKGVPRCLCNLEMGDARILYARRDGTVNYKNGAGTFVEGCP